MSISYNFQFTVFEYVTLSDPDGVPNKIQLPPFDPMPTLFGEGVVYVWYPIPTDCEGGPVPYDEPETFRLCLDGHSPLLRPTYLAGRDYYHDYFHMMGWGIDTRHYPNGPHTLTVASWLYFHTQEGSSRTVEVVFDNPESDLREPRLPLWNPNLPVPLYAEGGQLG